MKTTYHYLLLCLLWCAAFAPKAHAQEFGVTTHEVSHISDTGHNVQIWQILPDYIKNGTYEVSIKHAVAGEIGSFYIIAWADTNNDGVPDLEIGRSELKTAKTDGEWSSWKFTSDYSKVYVGNTWNRNNEKMYYQNGGNLQAYTGLSNKVFYARSFNGKPVQSVYPRFTNIRVRTEESKAVLGVTTQEVSKISDTGHNVQLWQILPEFSAVGTYEISIKHAVAGEQGAFYIMAWADTNNDGIPDKEIARSDLKLAANAGDWSRWRFSTNYTSIFVGNTWNRNDERVYYQNGGSVSGYTGLANKVFYARSFNGAPNQSTAPRFTNIKVRRIGN